jgi:hypothetical protein
VRDLPELPSPVVTAARVDGHASTMDMQLRAIAVDLDFMQPLGTIGRAISQGRITRLDECGEWRALRAGDSSDNSAVSPTLQRNGTHPDSIIFAPRDSEKDSLPLTARLNGSEYALINGRCRPLLSSRRNRPPGRAVPNRHLGRCSVHIIALSIRPRADGSTARTATA